MMMMHVTDLIAFLKAFNSLHHAAGQYMHPRHARTMSVMLDHCEASVIELERHVASQQAAAPPAGQPEPTSNVVHLHVHRSAPPKDGGAA